MEKTKTPFRFKKIAKLKNIIGVKEFKKKDFIHYQINTKDVLTIVHEKEVYLISKGGELLQTVQIHGTLRAVAHPKKLELLLIQSTKFIIQVYAIQSGSVLREIETKEMIVYLDWVSDSVVLFVTVGNVYQWKIKESYARFLFARDKKMKGKDIRMVLWDSLKLNVMLIGHGKKDRSKSWIQVFDMKTENSTMKKAHAGCFSRYALEKEAAIRIYGMFYAKNSGVGWIKVEKFDDFSKKNLKSISGDLKFTNDYPIAAYSYPPLNSFLCISKKGLILMCDAKSGFCYCQERFLKKNSIIVTNLSNETGSVFFLCGNGMMGKLFLPDVRRSVKYVKDVILDKPSFRKEFGNRPNIPLIEDPKHVKMAIKIRKKYAAKQEVARIKEEKRLEKIRKEKARKAREEQKKKIEESKMLCIQSQVREANWKRNMYINHHEEMETLSIFWNKEKIRLEKERYEAELKAIADEYKQRIWININLYLEKWEEQEMAKLHEKEFKAMEEKKRREAERLERIRKREEAERKRLAEIQERLRKEREAFENPIKEMLQFISMEEEQSRLFSNEIQDAKTRLSENLEKFKGKSLIIQDAISRIDFDFASMVFKIQKEYRNRVLTSLVGEYLNTLDDSRCQIYLRHFFYSVRQAIRYLSTNHQLLSRDLFILIPGLPQLEDVLRLISLWLNHSRVPLSAKLSVYSHLKEDWEKCNAVCDLFELKRSKRSCTKVSFGDPPLTKHYMDRIEEKWKKIKLNRLRIEEERRKRFESYQKKQDFDTLDEQLKELVPKRLLQKRNSEMEMEYSDSSDEFYDVI